MERSLKSRGISLNGELANLKGTYYRNGVIYRTIRMSKEYLDMPFFAVTEPAMRLKQCKSITPHSVKKDFVLQYVNAIAFEGMGKDILKTQINELYTTLSSTRSIGTQRIALRIKTCFLVAHVTLSAEEKLMVEDKENVMGKVILKDHANHLHYRLKKAKIAYNYEFLQPLLNSRDIAKAKAGIFK